LVDFLRRRDSFVGSAGIWNVPLEMQEADWKRNAGASKLIQRHPISLGRDKPHLVKSNVDFLKLPLGKETFYLTPDAILVTAGRTRRLRLPGCRVHVSKCSVHRGRGPTH
jgi:hypothetical protein